MTFLIQFTHLSRFIIEFILLKNKLHPHSANMLTTSQVFHQPDFSKRANTKPFYYHIFVSIFIFYVDNEFKVFILFFFFALLSFIYIYIYIYIYISFLFHINFQTWPLIGWWVSHCLLNSYHPPSLVASLSG